MKLRVIVIIAVLVLVSGGALYAIVAPHKGEVGSTEQGSSYAPDARIPPEGFEEYRSQSYRFSLLHLPSIAIKEFDEGGGAGTITFEDLEHAQGFQIFIVPYAETTISDAQFKKDVPSAVRTDEEAITLDGVPAVAFRSRDEALGETREVWVIRGGYLYEITAPRTLEAWLSEVLLTWKFL